VYVPGFVLLIVLGPTSDVLHEFWQRANSGGFQNNLPIGFRRQG